MRYLRVRRRINGITFQTHSNPEDNASRGLDSSYIIVYHHWFSSSSFLQVLDEGPKLKVLLAVDETIQRSETLVGLVQRDSNGIDLQIERKSRPLIIFNVTYLFCFIRNARQKDRDQHSNRRNFSQWDPGQQIIHSPQDTAGEMIYGPAKKSTRGPRCFSWLHILTVIVIVVSTDY